MFGLVKGSCSLKKDDQVAWMGHICGTCLALRDNGGHLARLTTNYDAALLSVLCEAQINTPAKTVTTRCPLRRQFKMSIVNPDSTGSQYAATISLLMGTTKIADNLADDDTALRYLPKLGQVVSKRWQQVADDLSQTSNFVTTPIKQLTQAQMAVEASPQLNFFAYSRPTELAVATAFQHTAIIANKPDNSPILSEIGRMFGRIMVLLDSYADYAADLANGKLNFLAAVYPKEAIQHQAAHIFQESYAAIQQAFAQLDLPQPNLAKALLLNGLKRRGQQVLRLSDLSTSACSCALPAANTVETIEDEDPGKQQPAKHGHSWYCCDGYHHCIDCIWCSDAVGDCCHCNNCDCDGCHCDCNPCDGCCDCN